jgi:hypothetical protein
MTAERAAHHPDWLATNACSTVELVRPEDIDGIRRSLAIGGTLTRADAERLLATCEALLAQRSAIADVLAKLGPSWRETRAALSELVRIVGGG